MNFLNCKHCGERLSGTSFLILLPEQDGYIECSESAPPLCAKRFLVGGCTPKRRCAVANLRCGRAAGQKDRWGAVCCSLLGFKNIDFNRPFKIPSGVCSKGDLSCLLRRNSCAYCKPISLRISL